MKIAILIPCFNEEITIFKVVTDFKKELPQAEIYVFDNHSTDNTALEAKKAGAIVRHVRQKGKGRVVSEMFRQVIADYYVMVDGDDTYSASHVKALLDPVISNECDMSVGRRTTQDSKIFPPFHRLGNFLITAILNLAFKSKIRDVFSGYRVLSRRLVISLPLLSKGFEIETELTIQTLYYGFEIQEINVPYRSRPLGSESKLSTFSDGLLVLKTLLTVVKDYKPLVFFLTVSIIFFLCSVGLGSLLIIQFIEIHKVTSYATAVLSAALMIISMLSFTAGLILDSSHRRQLEIYTYLNNKTIRSLYEKGLID